MKITSSNFNDPDDNFFKPGSAGRRRARTLSNPSMDDAAIPQAQDAVQHWNNLRKDDKFQSFLARQSALSSRKRMDFSGSAQDFDASVISNTERLLQQIGINVSRKKATLFQEWGEEDVLSINQTIRGKSVESYVAFGPTGGTYLANPDNLGGLRPVLGYYGGAQVQEGKRELSPAERIVGWLQDPSRSVMAHAQQSGAEWVNMQRLGAQPGLDRLYRGGVQFGEQGQYDSERRGLLTNYNKQYGTDYTMFQGVGSGYRASDYAGVIPTSESGRMLISKLKRTKLWTGNISGASLGVGTDLAQDDEPFYFQGMSGPNRSTVFREAFDLYSEHPEGASFANRFYGRRDFSKTLKLAHGTGFDTATNSIVMPDGTRIGENSYFGNRLGMANEEYSRAGGLRDFKEIFGTSARSYNAMAINKITPEMDAGKFTGRIHMQMSGYVPEYADKYGTKEEPMRVNPSYLPTDESGRRVDFWRRMPDEKELPAIAMQVFKAETGTTAAAREAFLDYATDQGVSFIEARRMFSEEGVVSGQGTELLSNLAIDRFKEGFQYHERSNVTLSQMQYDSLQGQSFSYNGDDGKPVTVSVLDKVTQNQNGTYTAGTFRTMRRFADVATNIRGEHTRGQMLVKPGAMSVMAQYNPEVFAAQTQLARERLNQNSSYNTVASYRANYSSDTRAQLENVYGSVASIDPQGLNAMRGKLRDANPDMNADQMLTATLRGLKAQYGNRSLSISGPQGDMILPNAGAILGNLTESKDRTLINNWARMAGEAISLTGDTSPESQQQLGTLLGQLSDPNDKNSLATHANRQGVLEKAIGFHQQTAGGLARAIPNLGVNEALMSMKHAMKVTGIDDETTLRQAAASGSLGTIFRYPWSDPSDQFVNPRISFYEDLPKDSAIRKNFPNPGQNTYVSNEIMAQLHGDVDGDRIGMMLTMLKNGEGRIVGSTLKAQSSGSVLSRTKNAFESEYSKFLESARERSGSFEALRPESSLPFSTTELQAAFQSEEGEAKSHLGKVYNALLRQMGGSVNPSTESMFGETHPLTRLIADSVGDINSYGIQSFVDRSAKRDKPFEDVMGAIYRGKNGYSQRTPQGEFEKVASGEGDFYQQKMLQVMRIGGNLKGEGYEDSYGPGNAAGDMEYRNKLAPAIATSLINRNELQSLYESGGEDAVVGRVTQMADLLTDMRTTGNYDTSQILPLTGASSFSEWGVGSGDLSSMSPMAEWVTGRVQLSHYDKVAKAQGTGSFAVSMGGASVLAGQAALQSRQFKEQVDKPIEGLEAMLGNQGGPRGLRGWISSLLPGAGNASEFAERMKQAPVMQQAAQNMGGIPIPGMQQAAVNMTGGIPIPDMFNGGTDFARMINADMQDPGKQDMSGIPIDQNLAGNIAARISGGSGGQPPTAASVALGAMGGGSGGGGGSNITNNIFRSSQPHLDEKILAAAAHGLNELNAAFKDTTEVVAELTNVNSEHREELVKTYEAVSKVANYARQLDSYQTQSGAAPVAQTTDLRLFQALFGNGQMGQVNELADALTLPVAGARIQGVGSKRSGGSGKPPGGFTYNSDDPFMDDSDFERGGLAGKVGRFGDRMIKGQGFFRAHMAYNMLIEPAFNSAEQYLDVAAQRGQVAYQGGQLSYGELMQGQYGNIRQRQARLESAQYNFGKNVYDAYGPLVDFAHGGSSSLLGAGAAIGVPALGAGIIGNTMLGSVAGGAVTMGAAALYGAVNYAGANSTNYYSIGKARNFGTGDTLGAIGQMASNAEGMLGFASAWYQRATGQMTDEEWTRVRKAPDYYNLVEDAKTGSMGLRDFAAQAQGLGYQRGTSVPAWQDAYIQSMQSQYGIGGQEAMGNLQFMQRLNPNISMTDPLLSRLSEYSAAGLNVPNVVGGIAASQNISPIDLQGTGRALGSFDLESLALTLREPGLSVAAAGARIEYGANRNLPVNQMRAMAGRELRSAQYGTFPLMTEDNQYLRGGDEFFYNPAAQSLQDRADVTQSQVALAAQYYGNQTGNQFYETFNSRLRQGDVVGANTLMQGYQTSASLYLQATTYGMSQQQATALGSSYYNLSQEQQGIAGQIAGGNRLVISQQAAAMGRPDLRTINPNTGMSVFFQDLDSDAISTLRSGDRYGYMSGVSDSTLALGTAGMQNQERLIQRQQFNYQRGMQLQQNALEIGARHGMMDTVRGIGEQYGITMNPMNTRGYRELEDAGVSLNRRQQDYSYAQEGRSLAISQRQFTTSGTQFYENYGLNQRQFAFNTGMQRQEMALGREQQLLQQGYQREDLAYNRAQSEIGFAWQMEDANRNIRYARGRQKRDLMREKKRAVIRFGMEQGQLGRQEGRLEKGIEYANKEFQLKQEQFEQSIKFRQEEMDLQKKHYEENRAFERERLQMQTENHLISRGFMLEERQLQNERLSLDRFIQDTFTQMSIQMQQKAFEAQTQVNFLNDAMTGISQQASITSGAIDVLRFSIAQLFADAVQNGGVTLPPVTGTAARLPGTGSGGGSQRYADGGYTGDGYKYEVAGIVHKGEYVVPQEGALVLQGDSDDTKLFERMVQLLGVIANNPATFMAVIDGVKSPTTPVYTKSQARL